MNSVTKEWTLPVMGPLLRGNAAPVRRRGSEASNVGTITVAAVQAAALREVVIHLDAHLAVDALGNPCPNQLLVSVIDVLGVFGSGK